MLNSPFLPHYSNFRSVLPILTVYGEEFFVFSFARKGVLPFVISHGKYSR